jgi:spermidine synthase
MAQPTRILFPSPLTAKRAAVVASGVTSLTIQVLLVRELMIAWRGNEMSFGVTLALWLAFTAVGALFFGAVSRRPYGAHALGLALLWLGVLAPASLLLARFARVAFGLPAGELAGLGSLVRAAAVSLAPFTILAGFTFALAVSVLSHTRRSPSRVIGEVYVLEAAGAAAAGPLLSFVLLGAWTATQIACLAGCAAATAALALALTARRRGGLRLASGIALAGLAVALGSPGSSVDNATVALEWRSLGFLAQTNSVYGRIVTTRQGTQESVFESGVLVASSPDRLTAEEAVHFPMLEHPAPRNVLLLGNALGGAAQEVLKHPTVSHVDAVELDPALLRAASGLGPGMTAGLTDPRVTVHYGDARFFVRRAAGRYDVVIVNVPDPTTTQLNRFYTVEFLREVARTLEPGGVVGLSLTSSEDYVGEDLARVLSCVRTTLAEVFPSVVVLPGPVCHLIASGDPTRLTRDPAVLEQRIEERRLNLLYVREYYLRDRLAPERLAAFDASLARAPERLNSDFRPIGYYLSLVVWDRELSGIPAVFAAAPRVIGARSVALLAIALALILVGPALAAPGRRSEYRRAIIAAVTVVGATEIVLEIASLFAFQCLYGYVYERLALLTAAFMGGLVIGGAAGRRAASAGAGAGAFAAVSAGMCALPLAFWAAVRALAGLHPAALERWAALFPVIVVGSALLAGVQFPLAARLLSGARPVGATGGRIYGADLLGAAVAAPACAVFLLPILGLAGVMQAFAALNAAVLIALVVSRRARPNPP